MAEKVEGSPVEQEHRGTCGNRGRSIPGSSLGWTDFRVNCFVYYYLKQNRTHFSKVQMLKEQQFYLLRMFRVWHSEEGGLNGPAPGGLG